MPRQRMLDGLHIQCSQCKEIKPRIREYWKFNHKGYRKGWCKQCEHTMNYQREKRKQHQDRLDAISVYGGKCVCCGETEIVFLTFDHINGGGNQHRQESRLARKSLASWLVRNNYPPGFRILCFNCHMALHSGLCPHKL